MNIKEEVVKVFNIKIAEKQLKQKEIAHKMGITEDRLSRILSSKSKMLAQEMIMLCAILDIDPNNFRSINRKESA